MLKNTGIIIKSEKNKFEDIQGVMQPMDPENNLNVKQYIVCLTFQNQ